MKYPNLKKVGVAINLTITSCFLLSAGLFNHAQLVALTFYYGSILFIQATPKSSSREFFNPITIAGLALLTFNFQVSNTIRYLVLLALLILLAFINRSKLEKNSINLSIPNVILIVSTLCIRFMEQSYLWLIQFLGYGYDNAFHLTLFRGYRVTSWFPTSNSSEWWTDFELFKVVPAGSSALFSIASDVLIGNEKGPYLEMATFAFLNLLTLALSIVFAGRIVFRGHGVERLKVGYLVTSLSVVALLLTYPGTMLINGFPPYVLVTALLIYLSKLDSELSSTSSRLLNLSFATFVILLITPGPFAFLLIPGMYLSAKLINEFIHDKEPKKFMTGILPPLILGFISLFTFLTTSGTLGWRQILSPGGVHRPNLMIASFILILFVFVFVGNRLSVDLLLFITFSGGISVAFLCIITWAYTGSVQYYAVKQFYVFVPICGIYILRGLNELRLKNTSVLASSISFVFMSSLFLALLSSGPSGYMGTPVSAVRDIKDSDNWKLSVVNARNFSSLQSRMGKQTGQCLISRLNVNESDLNSRWANSLSEPLAMSDNCFSGYWNSSILSTSELLNKLGQLPEKFIVLVPRGQEQELKKVTVSENIELRFE